MLNLSVSPDMSGENLKCPVKEFVRREEIEQIVCLNVKNVWRRFYFFAGHRSPAKSQNVRRGIHDSPVKMSGEAQNHLTYSDKRTGCYDKPSWDTFIV